MTKTYDQIGINSSYWQIELDAATRTRKRSSPLGSTTFLETCDGSIFRTAR
ncbi:MAG: hypothetical protein ABR517_11460 [Thermoanaerobaculia bacterium]